VAVGAFCMIGGFAERTVVDQASVVVIDRDIPLDLASLVACGVPAGVGAARHRARVAPGDSVLVVGCGGDGMNVVQGAQLCGAAKIIAADIVPAKLDWARGFGATHGVNAEGEDLTRAVLALTDGVGVDHAFVCIDPPATLLPAFRATAKGGNVVVTALTPAGVSDIRIPPLETLSPRRAQAARADHAHLSSRRDQCRLCRSRRRQESARHGLRSLTGALAAMTGASSAAYCRDLILSPDYREAAAFSDRVGNRVGYRRSLAADAKGSDAR
jgi:threonine dehydrogenase-like Zn-dependent dehydrogenase